MRSVIPLALAFELVGCTDPGPRAAPPPEVRTIGSASSTAFVPEAPVVSATSVSIAASREMVALAGPQVEAKRGDWIVESAEAVAVVSADEGYVLDYGLRGQLDGLIYVEPVVWDAFDLAPREITSIEGVSGTIHVTQRVHTRDVVLHTWVWLEGTKLRIDSQLVGDGEKTALAVGLGEIVRWGNTLTFVEGQGVMDHGGSFGTEFIGRTAHGMSYAMRGLDGPFITRFGWPEFPGFWSAARNAQPPVTVRPGEVSPKRRIALSVSTSSFGAAVTNLAAGSDPPPQRVAFPTLSIVDGKPAIPDELGVEIAHCEPGIDTYSELGEDGSPIRKDPDKLPDVVLHAPYARYAAKEGSALVPPGCFLARFIARGHEDGPWIEAASFASAGAEALPKAGRLAFTITDTTGGPTPAKIVVRGTNAPPPPKENEGDKPKPKATAPPPKATPDPDWGDDATNGASSNAVFTADGKGNVVIPPGHYHVFVGRGPEYTIVERDIHVVSGQTVELEAAIERVVDTAGWISGDLHVHAFPSFDAPVKLTDRALSLAGVGVEVVVGTDHNRVTDYRPAITEARLEGRLVSVIGDEVTSEETWFGHFNGFPLRADVPPPPTRTVPPELLFRTMRQAGPAGWPTVIQVNHPRMGDIGYFDLLRLDPSRVEGSLAKSPLWSADFDAIEVFNGDHYANIPRVEQVMIDWYALLRAGKRVTATGNSDSHKVTYQDVGEPRNWVAAANDDPGKFDERAFIDAIRAGRVVVSNGPFITMTAGETPVGGTVSAGDVELTVEVRAPDWIDVARVELVKNGRIYDAFDGPFAPAGVGATRGTHTFKVKADKGDFFVAIVRGDKPMRWLARRAYPFAFTNPIWVGP